MRLMALNHPQAVQGSSNQMGGSTRMVGFFEACLVTSEIIVPFLDTDNRKYPTRLNCLYFKSQAYVKMSYKVENEILDLFENLFMGQFNKNLRFPNF